MRIPAELKKGRNGHPRTILTSEQKVNVVFENIVGKQSYRALSRKYNCGDRYIAGIVRRNESLKNLFEDYMIKVGNIYGEHLLNKTDLLLEVWDMLLNKIKDKNKLEQAELKDLVDSFTKINSAILNVLPRDNTTDTTNEEAKAQLVSALTQALTVNATVGLDDINNENN